MRTIQEFKTEAFQLTVTESDPLDKVVALALFDNKGVEVDNAALYRDDVLCAGGDFDRVKHEMQQSGFDPLNPLYEGQYLG